MNHIGEMSDQERMIQQQIIERGIRDQRVIAALRAVPRDRFFVAVNRADAFSDRAAPIGHGQTISQPYIVALMTQRLSIEPPHRILEIGTGTGYQTAILAQLAADVYTIERVKPLLDAAWERLMSLGIRNVHFKHGDGTTGWPVAAPFDRLLITASAPELPELLIRTHLVDGGDCRATDRARRKPNARRGPPHRRSTRHRRHLPLPIRPPHRPGRLAGNMSGAAAANLHRDVRPASGPTLRSIPSTQTIDELRIVTPTRAKRLAELGIHTLFDLLDYFPRHYRVESAEIPISGLQPDTFQVTRGEVCAVDLVPVRPRPRYNVTLADGRSPARHILQRRLFTQQNRSRHDPARPRLGARLPQSLHHGQSQMGIDRSRR